MTPAPIDSRYLAAFIGGLGSASDNFVIFGLLYVSGGANTGGAAAYENKAVRGQGE